MGKRVSITKKFTFDAAHKLNDYDGKCANLHGHTYLLEVTITNKPDACGGDMVLDFSILKFAVQKMVLDRFDHKYINDQVKYNPTAENMAEEIYDLLDTGFSRSDEWKNVLVTRVRLYETPDSYAEVVRW